MTQQLTSHNNQIIIKSITPLQQPSHTRVEKTSKYIPRTAVSVRTSEVTGSQCSSVTKKDKPDRQCPIHNKPHPLSKCQGSEEDTLMREKHALRRNPFAFDVVHPPEILLKIARWHLHARSVKVTSVTCAHSWERAMRGAWRTNTTCHFHMYRNLWWRS